MSDRSRPRIVQRSMAAALALVAAVAVAPAAHGEDDEPQEIAGQAILAHPAGKAVVEAAKLLAQGRLGEVRAASTREVRDEWAGLTEAEQEAEAARARERAPDPGVFADEIASIGVLTVYGDSASLRIPTPDDGVSAMAFVGLEEGRWKVTGGPMTFDPPPVETAPPISGEAILDHEIGALVLEYSARLAGGRMDDAIALMSGPARAKRAAEPAEEQVASDEFRRRHTPPPETLAEQIRAGGELRFTGETAFLNVVAQEVTQNADGSTTFVSTTTMVSFELQDGRWMIGN